MFTADWVLSATARIHGTEIELDTLGHHLLSELLDSYEQVPFTALGRRIIGEELIRSVRGWNAWQELPPRELSLPPIVVAGLPRTGSTLLHNLLGQVDGMRTPSFVEAYSFGVAAVKDADAEQYLERLYTFSPAFKAIHPLELYGAEECVTALQASLFSERFGYLAPAYDYCDFLRMSVYPSVFERYRNFLASIGPDAQWVLKSPSHSFHLPALLQAFPGAVIVRMWRDPVDVIPSFVSLVGTLSELTTDEVDRHLLCSYWANAWAEAARRVVEDGSDSVSIDVPYPRLMRAPVDVVDEICSAVGVSIDSFDRRGVEEYLRSHPKDRFGSHRYGGLEDYGMSAPSVLERFGGSTR